MSNRKIFLIIGGTLGSILLLALIFIAVIFGAAYYTIGNSAAANTAKTFLKNSQKLKNDIGEVKDFGSFVTGSANIQNDTGEATINIKVIGEKKSVDASVKMILVQGQAWRVSSASYVNETGQTITILDPYDSKLTFPPYHSAAA